MSRELSERNVNESVRVESKSAYFLKNGFFVFLEKIVLTAKGVLVSYLLANYVERNTLGSYQYVVAFLSLIAVVSFPGMGTAVVQAVARGFEGTLFVGIRVSLRRSLLGVAILFAISLYYFFFERETTLSAAFFLIAVTSPSYIVASFLRQYYTAKEDFASMVKTTILIEGLTLVSFTTAILFFPGLMWLLLASVVASSVAGLFWMVPLLNRTRGEAHEPSNIEYGKKLSWSYVISTVSLNADKILLAHFLGFSEVALYSIAMIVPEQVRASLVTIPLLLLPKLSREDGYGYDKKFAAKIFFVSGAVAGVIFLAYFFLAPMIFSLLFPGYMDAMPFSRVLFLIVFSIPFLVLDTYYRSKKEDKIIFQSTLWGSVGGVGLMPILILFFGIYGAVSSKLLGYLLSSLFLAFRFFFRKS